MSGLRWAAPVALVCSSIPVQADTNFISAISTIPAQLTLDSGPRTPGLWSVDLHRFLLESPDGLHGRSARTVIVAEPWATRPAPSTLQNPGVAIEDGVTNAPVAASADFMDPGYGYQIEETRLDRLIRRIDEGGGGISSSRPTPTLLDKGIDVVFRPEAIRLGPRALMAFSPYTAIKRKNPFCLLNPVPFMISW